MTPFVATFILLLTVTVWMTTSVFAMVYTFKTPLARVKKGDEWKLRFLWYYGFSFFLFLIISIMLGIFAFASFYVSTILVPMNV